MRFDGGGRCNPDEQLAVYIIVMLLYARTISYVDPLGPIHCIMLAITQDLVIWQLRLVGVKLIFKFHLRSNCPAQYANCPNRALSTGWTGPEYSPNAVIYDLARLRYNYLLY